MTSASRTRLLHFLLILIRSILSRNSVLVVHVFGELVVAGCDDGSEKGTDPVDPVVIGEVVGDAVDTE